MKLRPGLAIWESIKHFPHTSVDWMRSLGVSLQNTSFIVSLWTVRPNSYEAAKVCFTAVIAASFGKHWPGFGWSAKVTNLGVHIWNTILVVVSSDLVCTVPRWPCPLWENTRGTHRVTAVLWFLFVYVCLFGSGIPYDWCVPWMLYYFVFQQNRLPQSFRITQVV